MTQNESGPKHLLSCFDIFVRINSLSSANFKYVKTQFYNRIYASATSIEDESKLSLRNTKHRYEKVSTPVSCSHIPRFQQKGLIVIWPQRKKLHNWATLTLLAWLLAHTMYFLYISNLLPSASVVALEKPPWHFKRKLRKPLIKDFIIEPDWESQHTNPL